jgi:MFS family permease
MSLSTLGIYSTVMPDILRFILCLVFSGISGVIPAAILSGAPVHAPEPHLVGTANGLILQGSNIGHLIGPPILALIVGGYGGWQGAPWLFVISGLVGLLLALVIRKIERPDRGVGRKA